MFTSGSFRPLIGALPAVRLRLEDEDRAEAAAVDHERPRARSRPQQVDAAPRQAGDGRRRGEREASAAADRLQAAHGAGRGGGRAAAGDVDDLGVRVRSRGDVGVGDRPVLDIGGGELEDRAVVPVLVDRGPERDAVIGVEGQLGRTEQAAVVLGRDPHGVGRAARGVRRHGVRDVEHLHQRGELRRERAQRAAGAAARRRRERDRCTEERLRPGVVDREARAVVGDLGVTGVGLHVEAQPAVARQPDPAVGGRAERERRALGQRPGREQVVGEVDAGADALDGRRRERAEHRLDERPPRRLGRGVRGAERRAGDTGAERDHAEDGEDGRETAAGGGGEQVHGEGEGRGRDTTGSTLAL